MNGKDGEQGQFSYTTVKKAGAADGGYVLASIAETYDKANATASMVKGYTQANSDTTTIYLCDTMKKKEGAETPATKDNRNCTVPKPEDLRYVLVR